MVRDLLDNMSNAVKAVVFYGARGVGKSTMARAFANEMRWHFVPCHVIDPKHLLLSTSRLKVSIAFLFCSLIKAEPCVVELNGYEKNLKLFVIGTTSNLAQIDESAPFERAIALSPPFRSERIQLFRAFLHGHNASVDDGSLETLADRTCRLSGLGLVIKAEPCVVEINGYEMLDQNQLYNELSDWGKYREQIDEKCTPEWTQTFDLNDNNCHTWAEEFHKRVLEMNMLAMRGAPATFLRRTLNQPFGFTDYLTKHLQ
ncbi:hypothetical protein niasHT_009615 [Heterodera trifolii]|uniref:ATPase AAA-type core domain-containing protein n=1 Tax=Heterodera trifolii TaxID=157864 RepID=A0ABD2LV75_9BILA